MPATMEGWDAALARDSNPQPFGEGPNAAAIALSTLNWRDQPDVNRRPSA